MGNSSSSGRGHQDETVDYGCLVPQGVYTGPRDWNQAIVSQLIVARRLAPFYRPLEDYEEDWDDDQILAARKDLPDPDNADVVTRIEATAQSTSSHRSKRPGSLKEPSKPEAQVYRGAVECPICFLYYPPNINHSRCCDQAICTECFVQIKRAEPTATHLVSEPAACPYCVQDNFGIVYKPPPWRAGLASDGANGLWSDSQRMSSEPITPPTTHQRRQKSFSADSPEVVTTDQIRPDWEAKLEAVRAAVARRANRRIIMRQVGDRLIPVGVTSGRVHALTPEEAAALGAEATSGSRRSRRRQAAQNGSLEQFMGMGGQDLEELMLMEAMRLSLLDHEEHQRKEAEEKKKAAAAAAATASGDTGGDGEGRASGEADSGSQTTSSPGPSTLETRSTLQPSGSTHISPSISSISRSGSPSPRQATLSSQESLGPGRRSWSISRSRTPPPPPNPIPNVPLSEENHAAWVNRPRGAPPFSTLNAALTSTSTAAAFLGPSTVSSEARSTRDIPSKSTRPDVPTHPSSTPPVPGGDGVDSPIPKITVDSNDVPLISHSTLDAPQSSALDEPSPSPAPFPSSFNVPQNSESSASATPGGMDASSSPISSIASPESESGTGTESYGFLPSSPESDFLHEPLLRLPHPTADIDDTSKSGQDPTVSALIEEVSR